MTPMDAAVAATAAAAAAAATFAPRSSTCSLPAAVSDTKQRPAVASAAVYHHESRCRTSGLRWGFLMWFALAALLFSPSASASSRHVDLVDHFKRSMEPLIFDRTPPPPFIAEQHLYARDHNDAQTSSTSTTIDNTTIPTAAPSAPAPLPRAFDTSLGINFTNPTCPAFFNSFLFDSQFRDCLPVSLLLQTSNAFFQATRSGASALGPILTASCTVDFQACSTLMTRLASEIPLPSNCGDDLGLQNPMVAQAYSGLLAYEPVFRATCLQDQTTTGTTPSHSQLSVPTNTTNSTSANSTDLTTSYCFANATTNTSSPTSGYIYYLPLGVPLPPGTQPACTKCLQQTMTIFQTYPMSNHNNNPSSTSTPPGTSKDYQHMYDDAANMIDTTCGAGFAKAVSSAASPALLRLSPSSPLPSSGIIAWTMCLGWTLFYLL